MGEVPSVSKRPDAYFPVRGQCPMGCGETLFLGADNYVTCSYELCSRPDAAAEMLREGLLYEAIRDVITRTARNMNSLLAVHQ